MRNCIFICVFNQEKYVDMFFLLLESILIYGILDDNTHILVYTSTSFMNRIKQSHLFNEKIKFEINNTYNNIDKACKARLDLFNLPSITNYNKILYLDTDILVKDNINRIFDVCKEDILYVLEEGRIESDHDHHGKSLFGDEINNYNDKTAFTSGILLFNNCEKIKNLFNKINEDIVKRPYNFICYDQPYIVYNAFKYNLYNNKILKTLVVNNDHNIHSNKTIHHFPGGPGNYGHKIEKMIVFLNELKNKLFIEQILSNELKNKLFIEQILSNGFTLVGKERLENLYNQCKKYNNTNYSFVECGVAKGGCLSMMKYASGEHNKIFGFDSFEGMSDITNEDISNYNKSCPLKDFGKVGDNLSGGIENVYNTFNCLNLNMNSVELIKGFFKDTLQIQENIDNIGEIAVLRLDGNWYESTKICLEKLYDKVIEGGVVIIDDYGHFVGAKNATDEFRKKNNINSPLIQTDYTEYYWVKNTNFDAICSNTFNIEDDIWTCSDKMRYDIFNFFKDKTDFKIAEIGSHKGYSTKILSKIFSKVYAVDNSVEWTEFNKNFNKDATNIEYVILDIYKDSWEILPNDIEISFIDAGHSYECCKSDILNSIKQFKNLQYIIFDDYGVWSGVKQIIDEMIENKILYFEKFIGLNDVPGPNGIVKNVNEGVICSINKIVDKIINNTYTWENSQIKFLDNYKMDAFGEGNYKIIDKQNIISNFGGREHRIKFNIDYTEFSSTRIDDLQIVNGKVINYTL
jgi:predicted O-methyltransferase YrrM